MGRRPSTTVATAAALGTAAAALRIPRALSDAFWQDEVASARILREPTFAGMLRHVARTESTPPLWYALAWLTHKTGVSIHDVRLLSVLFDGLLVALVVLLAERFLPLWLAAACGVLVAVGGQFSAHGRELRAYELFALLAVVLAFTVDAAARRPTRGRLLALGLTTAAGTMTHYFFAFTLIAAILWLWTDRAARAGRVRATLAIAAGIAVCAPWLPYFLKQYRQDRYSWIGPFNLREVLATPTRLFTPLLDQGRIGFDASLLMLVWMLAAGWVAWRRSPLARLCVLMTIVPLLLAAATWLGGVNIYAIRNMIAIGPFEAIVLIASLTAVPAPRRSLVTAVVCGALVSGWAWDQRVPDPPYNLIAHALVRQGWKPSDPVVVVGASIDSFRSPLDWYLPHRPNLTHVPFADADRHDVFAVGDDRAMRGARDAELDRVGDFVVARVQLGRTPARWLRHGRVLAARPVA